MIELVGDFWKEFDSKPYDYDVVVCTINQVVKANGELVMGAGIAKAFAQRFPELPKIFGDRIEKGEGEILVYPNIACDGQVLYMVGLPTKNDWRKPSPLSLVIDSCKQLDKAALWFDWKNILMTRPGCGHGGLDWNVVRERISFLDERFKVISNEATT